MIGLYLLAVPAHRRWLRGPTRLALALATLIFSPVIYWNAQHDWASMAFQSGRRVGEMSAFKPRFFALLVATQFLLVTPTCSGCRCMRVAQRAQRLAGRLPSSDMLLLLNALVPLLVFVR